MTRAQRNSRLVGSSAVHDTPILPDVLCPGLRVVFCGTAAGAVSAARGAYYAGPGNRFWRILAETGLTPRRLQPAEFRALPAFGIGLTDIVKTAFGADADLPRAAYDVGAFVARIRACRPRLVAFNGKNAAAAFYCRPSAGLNYGRAKSVDDFPPVWVLPSTSGAASGAWSAACWHELALEAAALD